MKTIRLAIILMLPIFAIAENNAIDCQLTPAIWSVTTPPNFIQSNNLRKKNGAHNFAKGQFINIVGQVLDENCTPVTGARVRIWQADALGHWSDEPDDMDINFAGSGVATTDNLGRYAFFTVMPATSNNHTPYINFSIYYQDLPPLETAMFFADRYLTNSNNKLKRQFNVAKRKLLLAKHIGYDKMENADIYEFNITLEGKLNYKQY